MVHDALCQACGLPALDKVLSLGYLPPVNLMQEAGQPLRDQIWMPTELAHCRSCELVQLVGSFDPAVCFPASYPYTSGTTRQLRENFADLAGEVKLIAGLISNDLVLDIGSNDGTLLLNFDNAIGVEPTDVADIAIRRGVPTAKMFFQKGTVREIGIEGIAMVVACCNCFAHMPNINGVIEEIKLALADNGIFVSESHYLPTLISDLQYDTIYHEHLRYYSLTSLVSLLERHELRVFHAKLIPTHGGSIRVYACHRSAAHRTQDSVAKLLKGESIGDDLKFDLRVFKSRVEKARVNLMNTLDRRLPDRRVVGIGAPSRASTVVNYCRLDETMIDYVCEISGSLKIGKYMPGTAIPVVDECRLFEEQPEYAVLFSWHIAHEIVSALRKKGYRGSFIYPMAANLAMASTC
jgi:SAM-dependent methyltransferase